MVESLRVLVVDDEPGIRLGVTRVLSSHRARLPDVADEAVFEVSQAGTGEEALAAVDASPPDLLLLDYKLPGISGLDVLERLAARPGGPLVVMITAYATIETAVLATKRGAYDFLAKPFTPDELRATVTKAATHLFLQRRARRLEEEKRQVRFRFVSVLAHELKAPLGAVQGYLVALRDRLVEPGSAPADEMLGRCVVRIEAMSRMISDLLDLTRLESGQKKRERVAVDLSEVARRALETAAPGAAAASVALELHAPGPVVMTADPGELEILLNNLVSNAVKYNRQGGRVDVTLSESDGRVTVGVADTGIGMTPVEVARLFAEFVRIRNEKTRDIPGSGLGLSIVRKLVELSGGTVSVESEPDGGTTFTVELPRESAAAVSGAAPGAARPGVA